MMFIFLWTVYRCRSSGSACLRTCACCLTPLVFRCKPSQKTADMRTVETRRKIPTSAYQVNTFLTVTRWAPLQLKFYFNRSLLTVRSRSRQKDSVRRRVLRLWGWGWRRPQECSQLQESQNRRREGGRREERWGGNKRYQFLFFSFASRPHS